MTNHEWQESEAGVMLFMPAAEPEPELEATQRSLTRLSVCEDEMQEDFNADYEHDEQQPSLLPIQSGFTYIQTDPDDEYLSDASCSSATLSAHDDKAVLTPDSSSSSIPSWAAMDQFFEELKACAEIPSRSNLILPSVELATPQMSTSESDVEPNTGYESDRTDFLLTPKSPCPSRAAPTSLLQTGLTSRFFRGQKKTKNAKPVRRILDFGVSAKTKVAKRKPQVSNRIAAPEYSPPHRWSIAERTFLCVLFRFYERSPAGFTKVFNSAFGLDLSISKVVNQLENYIRLYGAKAFPMYGEVMTVPFEDAEGIYDELRKIIETTAKDLGIELQRLEEEAPSPSGKAAKAKSEHTRKCYKSLVRKAAQQEKTRATQMSTIEKLPLPVQRLGGIPLVTDTTWNDDEIWTDLEDQSSTSSKPNTTIPQLPKLPHLVFRVWDDVESNRAGAKFTEEGEFIAQGFVDEPGVLPPPMPPNDIYNMWKYLAAMHLSKEGDTPLFISTAVSLLQTLCYSKDMKNPKMAVINLRAPCLQEEHKVQHAADVFQWLRAQGLTKWARYKGRGEFFFWASIPREAILHTFDLHDLWQLAATDHACATLLCPDAFHSKLKTKALASAIRKERDCFLNTRISGAIGRIGIVFGMNKPGVTDRHISEFIARLVDGLGIQKHPATDIQTMSTIAASFAFALAHPMCNHQRIMAAFIDGIEEGIECAARWSRSSSGGKRAKRRLNYFTESSGTMAV